MQNTYHSSVPLFKKSDTIIAYTQLHISVFLWGFTAILGELIEMPAVVLVWWRVLLTVISLIILLKFSQSLVYTLKHRRVYLLIGACIGLHWICFYGSIKYANASIALICMATSSQNFLCKKEFGWVLPHRFWLRYLLPIIRSISWKGRRWKYRF